MEVLEEAYQTVTKEGKERVELWRETLASAVQYDEGDHM